MNQSDYKDSVRLVKFLANAGVASRRKCDKLIAEGCVTVNGEIIKNPAHKLNKSDVVKINGRVIMTYSEKIYIMLNKPSGVCSTCSDPYAETTVLDLVNLKNVRLFPVGRLDKDSEGFIILTNDGEFANRICHPRFGITKTYIIHTDQKLSDAEIRKLLIGVKDDGEFLKADKILKKSGTVYVVILREGKKREVRRLINNHTCARIKRLRRTAIGAVCLDRKLPAGRWRYMTAEEVQTLLKCREKE